MRSKIYQPTPNAPWGDYGNILAHGMGMYASSGSDGRLPLERTGPFVPPVTMPWPLVVTADMRDTLERIGLTGLVFVPVHKARIVRYHWEGWDLDAMQPAEHPADCEPEAYVLSRPHDEALARSMPELFAIAPGGRAEIVKRTREPAVTVFALSRHDGSDFALAPPYEFPIVTERARAALESRWIAFEEIGWDAEGN